MFGISDIDVPPGAGRCSNDPGPDPYQDGAAVFSVPLIGVELSLLPPHPATPPAAATALAAMNRRRVDRPSAPSSVLLMFRFRPT
jgi:hypothetical protein